MYMHWYSQVCCSATVVQNKQGTERRMDSAATRSENKQIRPYLIKLSSYFDYWLIFQIFLPSNKEKGVSGWRQQCEP